MPPVTVSTIKLSSGHPVLDFTNTVDSRGADYGPDVLTTFADLIAWSLRVGLIDTSDATTLQSLPAASGEAALAGAKSLRETIYRIFSAPGAAAADDIERLRQQVQAAQAVRVLVPLKNNFAWQWRDADPDTISHRVAIAAADLLTSNALGRVHVCPGDNCGWLFLDTSRSGRRVWCSEETCGTRNRVRRWRSRQDSAGSE